MGDIRGFMNDRVCIFGRINVSWGLFAVGKLKDIIKEKKKNEVSTLIFPKFNNGEISDLREEEYTSI